MSSKVIIIAEAGVNHNGSIVLAKQLIDSAAMAGADYVKFQTFKAEKLASGKAHKAKYQIERSDSEDGQLKMLRNLELDSNAHSELQVYCRKKGIGFLSSAFDEDSIDMLDHLGVPFFKIPSGEITNKPYLQQITDIGKSLIISTRMTQLKEISNTQDILFFGGIIKYY